MRLKSAKKPKESDNSETEQQVVLKQPADGASGPKHEKVLILSSRGVTFRHRHLMLDLLNLLPHSKKDNKFDSKSELHYLNDLCDLSNSGYVLYFESRKHEDLYMWLAKSPEGPTVKFHVLNIHTMDELHFTGNCMQATRPILSFDAAFDKNVEFKLIKELFTQTFGAPLGHKKTKPYHDHVFQFSIVDNKIWFRNYQIVLPDGLQKREMSLVEIGPRFVLSLIRIFEGSFAGKSLAVNDDFVSPNTIRSLAKKSTAHKYIQRQKADEIKSFRLDQSNLSKDELDTVFE